MQLALYNNALMLMPIFSRLSKVVSAFSSVQTKVRKADATRQLKPAILREYHALLFPYMHAMRYLNAVSN